MTRGFLWATFVLATLVVVGVFVQVYLIGAVVFGAGTDALDAHKNVGGVVHTAAAVVFLTMLVGYWKRWGEVAFGFVFGVIGTVQVAFADADEWVGGLHALFALVVLVMAAIISHRAMRELGIGHAGPPGAPRS